MKRILLLILFLPIVASAQITSTTARRIRGGVTPPATCKATAPADVFIDTDAAAGQRLLVCTAANTWTAQGGTGDASGPVSSTDNAIVRFDGTTGKLVQNSLVTISDTGAIAGVSSLNVSGTAIPAWGATLSPVMLGANGSLHGTTALGAGGAVAVNQNAYFDGTDWKYISTDEASNYYQQDGIHNFRVAASGTAGTNVTWKTALTINATNGVVSQSSGSAVASAAAIVPTGNVFHVTGTTTITSITSTGIVAGARVTIIFDGILTFTDGSNLVLAGNFVTTANDTITLVFDGTNFYEVARAVN